MKAQLHRVTKLATTDFALDHVRGTPGWEIKVTLAPFVKRKELLVDIEKKARRCLGVRVRLYETDYKYKGASSSS
tara:strand:- start:390 stop:614 length:225 start_codon:yes stop_codon:yes gene_type:complete